MKIHPIKIAAEKLEPSIWNTAKDSIEGRNILIRCLANNALRSELEVIEWLNQSEYKIKDLNQYIIRDDTD